MAAPISESSPQSTSLQVLISPLLLIASHRGAHFLQFVSLHFHSNCSVSLNWHLAPFRFWLHFSSNNYDWSVEDVYCRFSGRNQFVLIVYLLRWTSVFSEVIFRSSYNSLERYLISRQLWSLCPELELQDVMLFNKKLFHSRPAPSCLKGGFSQAYLQPSPHKSTGHESQDPRAARKQLFWWVFCSATQRGCCRRQTPPSPPPWPAPPSSEGRTLSPTWSVQLSPASLQSFADFHSPGKASYDFQLSGDVK